MVDETPVRQIDEHTLRYNNADHHYPSTIEGFAIEDGRVLCVLAANDKYKRVFISPFNSSAFLRERGPGTSTAIILRTSSIHLVAGKLNAVVIGDALIEAAARIFNVIEVSDGYIVLVHPDSPMNTNISKFDNHGTEVWTLERRDDLGIGSFTAMDLATTGEVIAFKDNFQICRVDPLDGRVAKLPIATTLKYISDG